MSTTKYEQSLHGQGQEQEQTPLFIQDESGTWYQVVHYGDGTKLYWPISMESTGVEGGTSASSTAASSAVFEIEPSTDEQQHTFSINSYESMFPGGSNQMGTSFNEQQQQHLYDESLVAAATNFEKTYSQQQQMEGTEGVAHPLHQQDAFYFVGHEETLQESSATGQEEQQQYMNTQERKKAAKLKRAARQQQLLREHQQAAAEAPADASPDDKLFSDLSAKYARQRFPVKLWNLASDRLFTAIAWSEDGTSLIMDEYQLEPALKYFFRSHKFSSFLRQLHLYGFRKMTRMRSHKGDQEKVRTDYISEYGAEDFLRGNLDLAKKVRLFYLQL